MCQHPHHQLPPGATPAPADSRWAKATWLEPAGQSQACQVIFNDALQLLHELDEQKGMYAILAKADPTKAEEYHRLRLKVADWLCGQGDYKS